MKTLEVNDSISRAREAYLSQYLSMGNKRNTWHQFGYPEKRTFDDYLKAYLFQPAGTALIDKMHGKCWSEIPKIKQKQDGDSEAEDKKATPWEKEVDALFSDKSIGLWSAIKQFDTMQMVGRYAGMILRIADGKNLDQPAGTGKLVDALPCWESQLRVTSWENDINSANYGMPKMFQYQSGEEMLNNPDLCGPVQWFDIHPSRVFCFGEGAPGKRFWEGIPWLQPCYNRLIDLEKVDGGGAESYLKNSTRTVAIEFDKGATLPDNVTMPDGTKKTYREAVNDQVSDLNRNIDAVIALQGGKADTLQVTVADPTGIWTVLANEVAASRGMPFTEVFGMQLGRLASEEDQKTMAKAAKSRQNDTLNKIIEGLVLKFVSLGFLKTAPGDFVVEWPDLLAMSDKDKLANGKTMAETNKAAIDAGLPPVYDGNEIRAVSGYKPRDESEEAELLAKMQQAQPDPAEPEDTPADDAEDEKEGMVNAFSQFIANWKKK